MWEIRSCPLAGIGRSGHRSRESRQPDLRRCALPAGAGPEPEAPWRERGSQATLEGLPPIFLDAGDRSSAGLAIKTKAATYLDLGELQEALDANEEALALFDACGDQMNYCSAVMDSAFIFNEHGQFSDALSILESVETRLNTLSRADADYQWLVLDAARAQNFLALESVEEAAMAATGRSCGPSISETRTSRRPVRASLRPVPPVSETSIGSMRRLQPSARSRRLPMTPMISR